MEDAFRLLSGCEATIRNGFKRALCLPALNEFRLPWPERFTSAKALCATSLHESVHWSARASRLNRQFGQCFGDAAHALKELMAELGSVFLMGHRRLVDATVERQATYLDS